MAQLGTHVLKVGLDPANPIGNVVANKLAPLHDPLSETAIKAHQSTTIKDHDVVGRQLISWQNAAAQSSCLD